MNATADIIKRSSRLSIIWGVATMMLGILALFAPLLVGLSVTMLVAILLMAAGIAQTVFAFQARSFGKGALKFLFGGITLVCGISMLMTPLIGLSTLTLLLMAYFLIDGIFTIVAAFDIKPVKGWGWMLFNGIITVLLAGMIWWEWPLSGAWAIGVLLGVRLIFSGLSIIMLGSVGASVGNKIAGAS